MKYLFVFVILFSVSCKSEKKGTVELEVLDFNGFTHYLEFNDSKTYVVNFWATWCAPCVKELPHFEMLQSKYKDSVEVILVSLDFPHQYDTKLVPFIQKHDLKSKIVVLDDPDMNSWIPKVDPQWDGAIPVTLIYNTSKRLFYSRTFSYQELEAELKTFLL
jgi:thiol-disulfide isomerase/thioredoxin